MPKKVSTLALTGLLSLSLFSSLIPGALLVFTPQTVEAASPAITSFLQSGSSGTQVTLLQQALYRLGYLTAAPSGTYGPLTVASVKKFQLLNGLPQTGSLDTQTMYLVNLIIARFGAGTLASTPKASVPSTTYIPTTSPVKTTTAVSTSASNSLTVGSTGAHVLSFQQMLISQKLLASEPTGYYGALTKAAVVAYQSSHGLPTTGVADTQTQSSIASAASKTVAANIPINLPDVPTKKPITKPTTPTNPTPTPTPTPTTPITGVKDEPIIRYAPPILSFSANTTSIANGGSVTLTWATTYATFCSATGASFNPVQPINGSALISNITSDQTYTLTCSGPGGQETKSVTIKVSSKSTDGPKDRPIIEPAPPTPAPAPAPVPNPASKPVVLAEGDSISIFWAGNYTGIYAAAHPGIQFYGTAVGGSGIAQMVSREATDFALKPSYVTVFIGANDMGVDAASNSAWLSSLWAYVADIKRSTGAKVAVATVIGHCIPDTTTFSFQNYNKSFNQQRVGANNAIRAAVGSKIDAVIDFAGDSTIGTDAAACNTAILPDGTHPSDLGQQKMAAIYTVALDALIAGTTVPTGGNPTPIPTPPSTPTPTPPTPPTNGNPGPTASDPVLQAILDAVQVPSIASNFDRNQYIVNNGFIPGDDGTGPGSVGAFRFICNVSHEAFDDPIVYPGQPGKSHLHEFFGNTLTNANSTYPTLRTTGNSTCNDPLNRSAYWIPAMLDANDKVVRPDYISIYYKRIPETVVACKTAGKGCVPLPRGLKYVMGYNLSNPAATTPPNTARPFYFNCDGPTAVAGHYDTLVDAAANCPAGNRIGAIVIGPDCWDGKNLDSADHRSHMGYSNYRKGDGKAYCPDEQPYIVPQFTLGAWYAVDSTLDHSGTWAAGMKTWHFASDNMPNMPALKPGTTFHGDWWGAWDDPTMKTWMDNCINTYRSCSGGVLGNGTEMKNFSGFSYTASPHLVDQPSRPNVAMMPPAPLIPSASVAIGSKTPEVTAIQQILKTAGYFKQAVTGFFGPVTQAALAAYNKGTQYAGAASATMPGMH